MPLSFANGICTPQISAFLTSIGRCSERHERSLSGFVRLPFHVEKMTRKNSHVSGSLASRHFLSSSRRRRRRRSKLFENTERILSSNNGSMLLNDRRAIEAHSVEDSSALVLDRCMNEPDLNIDDDGSIGPRKIEVVGKDLDLEEEISLLRKKEKLESKRRRKYKEVKMGLDALQSWTENVEALVSQEVQLRSEGDASNLAQSDDRAREEFIIRENQINGSINEMVDFDGHQETNYSRSEKLIQYIEQLPTRISTLPEGGQLVADLTTAWDGLSGRLSPSVKSGKAMQQLMSALKLTLSAIRRSPGNGRSILAYSLSIAYTLADLQMDGTIIAAGLLRFVAEAGLVNISDVSQDLGADISRVLYDCMRFQRTLDQMDLFDEESARAVRQFCLSYHDIRSIIIEFSARLHLMRHAHELARYRQQILALEALQVHAPLAHATGNKEVSTELEDLSFNVIFPESYQSLDNWLSSHWPDGNTILEECKVKLSIALENDVKLKNLIEDFTISARVKSRFSTMKKLLKDGRKPEEIYDIMGLRVVVNPQTGLDEHETMKNGEAACYRVLGIVKSTWKEVPGRRKDYISKPKPNGYKSLHVAVHIATSDLKQPTMELQIRTSTMDFIANDGDASHSLYKGGLTDPEQVQQLKKLMMAAADRAALSLKELTGEISLVKSQVTEDQVFMMFDKNNDGEISMTEFQQVLGELGADKREAHELMQLVDTNRDGSVSPEEFAEFKKQVRVLQGFDKEFRNKLGWSLGDESPESTDIPEGVSVQCNVSKIITSTSFLMDREKPLEKPFPTSTNNEKDAELRDPQNMSSIDELQTQYEPSLSLIREPSIHDVRITPSDRPFPTSINNGKDAELEDPQSISYIEKQEMLNEPSLSLNRKPSIKAQMIPLSPKSEFLSNEGTIDVANNVGSNSSAVVIKKPLTLSRPSHDSKSITDEANASEAEEIRDGLKMLRRLISKKDFESAKALAKQLYEQYPYDADVLVEYAYVERQRGDLVMAGALYAQAITIFEKQQNLGYDYIRALQALGSIEAHARNAKRARVLFMESIDAANKAEEDSPEMVQGAAVYGLHAWARLEEQLGNWKEARDLLSRAAQIQPGNAVIHQSRALLEAKAHNWGVARHHFRLAVKANPKDVKCWHAWALFESRQGKPQKMRQLFQKVLEIDPNNIYTLQAWACKEALIGTPDSKEMARSLFRRCIQADPGNLHSLQAWAVMEAASENYDEARQLFEKCIQLGESCIVSIQAYAKMERKLGNLVASQRLLRKALRIDPENAAALMEAAFVEESLGNDELAQKLFVLAGIADKRKSRVNHKIFMSRKASRSSGTLAKNTTRDKLNIHVDKESSSYMTRARKPRHKGDTPRILGARA